MKALLDKEDFFLQIDMASIASYSKRSDFKTNFKNMNGMNAFLVFNQGDKNYADLHE